MSRTWIIVVATVALAGGMARGAEPDRIAQIEDSIKHARNDYQKALSEAVDALEKERQSAVADGDRERTGRIANLIDKLKGPLITSGAFADKELDSLFSSSKGDGAVKGLVHLAYDWSRPEQFADWRAENPPAAAAKENPRLVAGTLVFQGATGAKLRFMKRLVVRSVRLEVEAVDSFQAMGILIGGAGFRVHFAQGYIADLPGEATKVTVNLQNHIVVAAIDISAEGDATLDVAGARVSRSGVVPGEFSISIDQPGAVRIRSIVIDGTAP